MLQQLKQKQYDLEIIVQKFINRNKDIMLMMSNCDDKKIKIFYMFKIDVRCNIICNLKNDIIELKAKIDDIEKPKITLKLMFNLLQKAEAKYGLIFPCANKEWADCFVWNNKKKQYMLYFNVESGSTMLVYE